MEVSSPEKFVLLQNYPNPFNPSTTIGFSIPQASNVTIEIYNVVGERVASLVNQTLEAGYHNLNFDASNLAIRHIYLSIESKWTERNFC